MLLLLLLLLLQVGLPCLPELELLMQAAPQR
jgi:hypothetical protein